MSAPLDDNRVQLNDWSPWGWETNPPVLNSNHLSGSAIDMNHGCTLEVDDSLRARFSNWVNLWRYRLNIRRRIADRIIWKLRRIIIRLEKWT